MITTGVASTSMNRPASARRDVDHATEPVSLRSATRMPFEKPVKTRSPSRATPAWPRSVYSSGLALVPPLELAGDAVERDDLIGLVGEHDEIGRHDGRLLDGAAALVAPLLDAGLRVEHDQGAVGGADVEKAAGGDGRGRDRADALAPAEHAGGGPQRVEHAGRRADVDGVARDRGLGELLRLDLGAAIGGGELPVQRDAIFAEGLQGSARHGVRALVGAGSAADERDGEERGGPGRDWALGGGGGRGSGCIRSVEGCSRGWFDHAEPSAARRCCRRFFSSWRGSEVSSSEAFSNEVFASVVLPSVAWTRPWW